MILAKALRPTRPEAKRDGCSPGRSTVEASTVSRTRNTAAPPLSEPVCGPAAGSVFGGFESIWRQAAKGMAEDVLRSALPILIAEMRATLAEEGSEKGGPATYVTVKSAAAMMSAHPATVRRLIAAGKLGRYSVESQARVRVSDIHAYMAREGAASPTVDLEARALAMVRNE
jgi:excisionase family DNA binding protein